MSKKTNKKPKGCVRGLIILVQLALVGVLFAIIGAIGAYVYFSNQLADAIEEVVTYQGQGLGGTPRFYDRNGELLFEMATIEKRRALAYSEIPVYLVNATVAVEDDSFWTNMGFDPMAIGGAIISNYRNTGRPVGASTITQQLVRHIAFDYEDRVGVSYERKLNEIFLAYIMTQQRSKKTILQLYLNEIYYGNLAYGIDAAAQTYFGKTAVDLNLAEATFLAGLPQSPIQLDPYTNFEGAKARQEIVVALMLQEGYIDEIDAAVAKGAPLHIRPLISANDEAADSVLQAPHFVLYVQKELERRYGSLAVARGGWQITTSLDMEMQNMTEQMAREWVTERSAEHDVSNTAVVILKPSSGEILTMLGSVNYFDDNIDGQFNMTLEPRQPGSSIKPITFAAAMERGWSAGDVLWDVPIKLDLGGGKEMIPVNYDGRYHGPVLLRDALANSYNIPPIQLIRDIGVGEFIRTANKMGLESLEEGSSYYGLALTLGGGEVPLLEMSRAYATFANMGRRPHLTSILQITDSRGHVVFDVLNQQMPPVNAITPSVAYIITDILDDDAARLPAMGYGNPLELPFPAAAKTGTTNDFRDNWTMGYTPNLVVGVWVGNTNGRFMKESSGLYGAAPLWRRIMETVHDDPRMMSLLSVNGQPPQDQFTMPVGVENRIVCLPQGTGGSSCTAAREELFAINTPQRGTNHIGYNTYATENPGAWTLNSRPITADEAARVPRDPLDDGTIPPYPSMCVINTTREMAGASRRLYLPMPPFYPDEVRARIWASGRYQMAPESICSSAGNVRKTAVPPTVQP